MGRHAAGLVFGCLCLSQLSLQAQDFRLFDRTIQVHGFFSQGYVYTAENNWLTMTTRDEGSAGFTDMALNMSTGVTDKFRIGAQVYDYNLGQLGQYHPWTIKSLIPKPSRLQPIYAPGISRGLIELQNGSRLVLITPITPYATSRQARNRLFFRAKLTLPCPPIMSMTR